MRFNVFTFSVMVVVTSMMFVSLLDSEFMLSIQNNLGYNTLWLLLSMIFLAITIQQIGAMIDEKRERRKNLAR